LQAMRHVAADACDEVEVGVSPFFCHKALELIHGLRVPSVHASLEIVPQLLDRIEIGTPRRPVDEVDAVVVEPYPAGASGMGCRIVLLKPPLPARPELMSGRHEVETEDGLVASRVQGIDVELRVAQPFCADAAPEGHFALETLILLAGVLRVEPCARRTLHIFTPVMPEIEVCLVAEQHTRPVVLRPSTVAFSKRDTRPYILMLGSLDAAVQISFVEAATDCACGDVELQRTNDVLRVVADVRVGV